MQEGPVAQEDQLAVLERAAALLFEVGDGVGGEEPVLEAVHQQVQALLGLGGVDGGLALGVHHGAAGGGHGLGEVDREGLVLVELAGVAGHAGSFREGQDGLAGGLHLVPGLGRGGDAGGLEQVRAEVEQRAVGVVRGAHQGVPVGRGVDGGGDHLISGDRVRGQRQDPLVGGELGGPDHVQVQHAEGVRLDLRVLDELLALLVRGVGQFDERDLLLRVGGVPFLDALVRSSRGIAVGDVVDGALALEGRGGGLRGALRVRGRSAAAGEGDGGDGQGCGGGEKSLPGAAALPHVLLLVLWGGASRVVWVVWCMRNRGGLPGGTGECRLSPSRVLVLGVLASWPGLVRRLVRRARQGSPVLNRAARWSRARSAGAA
ncbi:hypothetical protein SRABI26_01045 [Arthrobacter sp. Bi26]|nr:hypothetical protein SRABI26_01045 [Arthrobacter sp. Bi26]